ncbi:hypothetical protein AD928_00685 [Acetobacter cerevisiae]|uniref:Uncharacterized protein n=1 Tax=Acetobacter cerevisiae TaxID=178900 RepID=A0A149QZF4_9PROT|nr:hypothetical protein AD928_00685 [Acetobacter cerevisiae]
MEDADLLAIQFRHVRMQQRRRGRGFGQPHFDLGLARFKLLHACLENRTGKAIQDRLNGLVEFALDFGKFGFQGSQIGSFFHPQPVDLSCELLTKFLEEGGIHHLGLQTVENGFFQNVPPDCQAVLAGALVAGG